MIALCGLCQGRGYLDEDGPDCGGCDGTGEPGTHDPETLWPVVVEERSYRLLWIEGETHDAALAHARADGDLYEMFHHTNVLYAWWEVGDKIVQEIHGSYRPDSDRTEGPLEKCRTCDRTGPVDMGGWFHDRECPRFPQRQAVA